MADRALVDDSSAQEPQLPDVFSFPPSIPPQPRAPPPTARVACKAILSSGIVSRTPQEPPDGPGCHRTSSKDPTGKSSKWFPAVPPIFCYGTLIICIAIPSFAYMVAHGPVDAEAILQIAKPGCDWKQEAWKLNPTLCFKIHWRYGSLTRPGRSSDSDTHCGGPIVEQLFEDAAGADGKLDLTEAWQLKRTIDRRLEGSEACDEPSVGAAAPSTCIVHATTSDAVGAAEAERFMGCLVGHRATECRATLCA